MIKINIKSVIVFFTFWIFFSCKENTSNTSERKAPILVSAVPISENDIKEFLTFNGVTQYQKKENIRSNVTGYISWITLKVGDRIKSGMTFASVRTKEQDALKEAVKIDSSLSKFIAPIHIQSNVTGVITALNINQNDYIAEGDILATVVEPKSLVVQVNVPYEYGNFIRVGSICDIILQNEESITGRITGVLPTIDPIAQSQTFLIELPNVQLPENLNVQVRTIYKENTKALSIPKIAIQTNELLTEHWVMKVVDDSLALKQYVTPLLQNDSLVQIVATRGELKLGDMIITEGAYQMQDSTYVRLAKK